MVPTAILGTAFQKQASNRSQETQSGISPIHVEDYARAFIHLLETGHKGEQYILVDDRPIRSADITTLAGSQQLRALAQYAQMVQQQSSALFPSAKGRVANYLSIVALSLINKSPVYIVEGTKYTFSKQSGKTFILKINIILMGNKNNNAKENEMFEEFSQI